MPLKDTKLVSLPILSFLSYRILFTLVLVSALLPYDISVFQALNSLASNQVVAVSMIFLTYTGSEITLLVGAAILWLKTKTNRLEISLVILFTIILTDLVVLFTKTLYYRPRPFQTLSNVILPLGPDTGSSFPSGHTARSFAVATYLLLKKGGKYTSVILVSLGVAASRVILGVHYPLDVTAGALLGIIIGVISLQYGKPIIDQILRRLFHTQS